MGVLRHEVGIDSLSRKPFRRFKLYECFVDHYVEREVTKRSTVGTVSITPDELRAEVILYSSRLAVTMTEEATPKVMLGTGSRFFAEATPFSVFFDDPSMHVVRDASPLRVSATAVSFIHKSIQEYFVARAIRDVILRGVDDAALAPAVLANLPSVFDEKKVQTALDTDWTDPSQVSQKILDALAASLQRWSETSRRDAKAVVRLLQALYRSPLMTVELSTEEAVRDFLVDVLLESVETTSALATVVSVCRLTPALAYAFANLKALVTGPLPKRNGGRLLHEAAGEGAANVVDFVLACFQDVEDADGKTAVHQVNREGRTQPALAPASSW